MVVAASVKGGIKGVRMVVVVVVAMEVGQGVGHGTMMILDHALAWPELLRVILR